MNESTTLAVVLMWLILGVVVVLCALFVADTVGASAGRVLRRVARYLLALFNAGNSGQKQ